MKIIFISKTLDIKTLTEQLGDFAGGINNYYECYCDFNGNKYDIVNINRLGTVDLSYYDKMVYICEKDEVIDYYKNIQEKYYQINAYNTIKLKDIICKKYDIKSSKLKEYKLLNNNIEYSIYDDITSFINFIK